MNSSEATKSQKILKAIYELDKKSKEGEKITKEKMIIQAWKMFPSEFSMKGYPQYPNADISKYITALFRENFLKGGFYGYKITEKGKEFIEGKNKKIQRDKVVSEKIRIPREIGFEINRILKSKVFGYFVGGGRDFLESDLFDFLGTSARSFKDSNQSNFLSRYNLLVKEAIPFCKKNEDASGKTKEIVNLWETLKDKFPDILKNEK